MRIPLLSLILATTLVGCATSSGVARLNEDVVGEDVVSDASSSASNAATPDSDPSSSGGKVVPYEDQDAATREANARLKGYFPNHELTTQDGKVVRFYDDLIQDRKVLINFMYVECDGL